MPDFARIESFTAIESNGRSIVPSEQPIERQDIAQIQKFYGNFFSYNSDGSFNNNKQEISPRGQLPTGTYIIADADNIRQANTNWTGLIFTKAKQEGSGANAIYYNEGVSILDHTKDADDGMFYLYVLFSYRPPWASFFVRNKQLSGIWVKQGELLRMPYFLYIKENGKIKKLQTNFI